MDGVIVRGAFLFFACISSAARNARAESARPDAERPSIFIREDLCLLESDRRSDLCSRGLQLQGPAMQRAFNEREYTDTSGIEKRDDFRDL